MTDDDERQLEEESARLAKRFGISLPICPVCEQRPVVIGIKDGIGWVPGPLCWKCFLTPTGKAHLLATGVDGRIAVMGVSDRKDGKP